MRRQRTALRNPGITCCALEQSFAFSLGFRRAGARLLEVAHCLYKLADQLEKGPEGSIDKEGEDEGNPRKKGNSQ